MMRDAYKELTVQFKINAASGGAAESAAPDTHIYGDAVTAAILENAPDESWFYALSPERINVIEYLPWKRDMDVLEIGALYGVYTGIADRVQSFNILEDNGDRRDLIKARAGLFGYENISFAKASSGRLYDAVIISLLDTGNDLKDPGEAIKTAAEALKDGGWITVIADNENALRYMTGAEREAGRTYVTAEEIISLADKNGLRLLRTYYPLNNASYARNIFSDGYMPGKGDFRGINESYSESRYVLCSDEAIYGGLVGAGAFRDFAPSYVFVLSKTSENAAGANTDTLPVYAKYNRMRASEYALKTEIFINGGKKRVLKTAITLKGCRHIEDFKKREDILNKDLAGRIRVLPAVIGKNAQGLSLAEFEFVSGRDLGKILAENIKGGLAPHDMINEYISLILGDEGACCHNMDSLFENVLLCDDGYVLIDYEWVTDEPLDRQYIRYRMLRYWYEAYSGELKAYGGLEDFLEGFGITGEQAQRYAETELDFQNRVRGAYKELEERFIKPQTYAYDIRERLDRLKESLEEIELLKSEIKEHKAALRKEREVERLSQNHIRNIELINKMRENEIEALKAENQVLSKNQSILSKVKRRLIARLDEWAPADSKKRVLIHYAKDTVKHPAAAVRMLTSGEGRLFISGDLEIGGEFHKGGILTVPHCGTPLVSIVIPAYNQVGYTYACIRSIIENTDMATTPYEIILADDVSTDATKDIGKYIRGLVISRNTSNMGFLKNCNQAAAKARGRYIFFLNNDTKVHKNWLSSLVSLIGSDESIGMAGSKLVYPDGRLQEAGGIIWSDASGWNYGRLDDPDKPEYNYVKDVDYISGASIMLSKELWQEIGGFDERFAPAYCEDSDLAFEVRKRGKRVVLQPESVVTHFEGISNGTDVSGTGLKRYQVVNAEKFREKWKEELKFQEENNGNPDPFTARDRSRRKPCVVIVDHYIPTWDRDAGSRTTYQYIRMFLKKGFNVKFIGDNFLNEEPYSSALRQMGVEILYGVWYENNILEWLKKNSRHIDVCYLNRPHITVKYIDFLKKETDIKCIFYGHDLHFMRLAREYELTGDVDKLRESNYWKSVEFSVMQEADMVYYPSETEIDAIHKIHPEIPAKAITAYLWDEFEDPEESITDYERRKDILFVGGFKHPPNADAVKWFVKDIFPEIRRALPEVKFLVAGSGADEDILSLSTPDNGVEVLGFVSDERLKELYDTTRVVAVPLRYGAGVKGKIVEALYNHAVVVTTSVGSEGIPEAEKAMIITDRDPDRIYERSDEVAKSFAKAVIDTYKNTALLKKMSLDTAGFIKKHYSLDSAWSVVEEDFMIKKGNA